MKSAIIVLSFSLCHFVSSGQSFFTLGANYSTTSTDRTFPFGNQKLENFRLAPSFGYGYNFQLNEKWSYQPGIYLSDLGSIIYPKEPETSFSIWAASLDQFVDYKPLKWFSVALSPSVYYVSYAGAGGNFGKKINWERTGGGEVNRLVFSIVPRVSFHLQEKWSLNLFYRNDLTSVGYPLPLSPGYEGKAYIGYGVGVNLKFQIQSKRSS